MSKYLIKKIIPVDNNLSLKDCQKILFSNDVALGVLDESRDISAYVLVEHIERALRFDIENLPIRIISTECKNYNTALEENPKNDYFIAKNSKDVEFIVIPFKEQEVFINLKAQYKKNLCEKTKKVIELCSAAADKIDLPIYLIGGAVRDIILEKGNFDIDITVPDSAVNFANYLKKTYPEICMVKDYYEDFNTAKVVFNIDGEIITIDIASTRLEVYAFPASLPVVKETGCNLKEDIIRRDFTINSMAISLNPKTFGNLIDYLGGYDDLKHKIIKILHPLSFIDDPTRIIRALKFGIRFGCKPDEFTQHLQDECLKSGLFDDLGGERIKSELKQTFNLNFSDSYDRFLAEDIYRLVFSQIDKKSPNLPKGKVIETIINKHIEHIKNPDLLWLIYLGCMFADLNNDEVTRIVKKLNLNSLETKILISGNTILKNKDKLLQTQTMFEVYEFFECHFTESILMALAVTKDETIKCYIEKYLNELQFETISTTGKTLIEKGFQPGPEFGYILRDILKEKINGNINSKEDEELFLSKISQANYVD